MLSPLSKITNHENTSQFKLVEDSSSNRIKDLLLQSSMPITLHDSLLTFRDTGKEFELKGDTLRMITNKNCIVDLACFADKILMYGFEKAMYFDVRATGIISTWDRTLIKLLKSPGLMVSASGVSMKSFSK